ncbi:MAG: EAL domain-containing protein [Sedimenticola sp.]
MNQLSMDSVSGTAGTLMSGAYDIVTVLLSIMIAVMAAYAAIELVVGRPSDRPVRYRLRLFGGALTLGLGIWSMHFVGMLAYRLPVDVYYDIPTILASIIPAWIGAGIAFSLIVRKRTGQLSLLVAAMAIGLAISGMHYIGMAAMRLPASMSYNVTLFATSISVAVFASYFALRLILDLRGRREAVLWVKQLAAAILGLAVAAMHYLGMAAVEFRWLDVPPETVPGISLVDLDWLFALIAIIFFIVVLIFGSRDRYSEHGMSLSSKAAVIAALAVAISTVTVGVITYRFVSDLLLREKVEEQGAFLASEVRELSTMMVSLEEDVRFFAQLPQLSSFLQRYNQAFMQPGNHDDELEHLGEKLPVLFRQFLSTRSRYLQVRLVGIVDGGREVIRVERMGGEVIVVEASGLQQKAGEPYFEKTLSLARDEVHFSDLSLNREYGRIAEPRTWVLRASSPVFSRSGEPLGFFIINVNFSAIFQELLALFEQGGSRAGYIADRDGKLLVSMDPRASDGTMKAFPGHLYDLYEGVAGLFMDARAEKDFSGLVDSVGKMYALNISKFHFAPRDPGRFIAIAQALPYEELEGLVSPVRDRMLQIVLVMSFLTAFIGAILVRGAVFPLIRISRAAEVFSQGSETISLPPSNQGGEIGALAKSFRMMVQKVSDREFALKSSEALVRNILDKAGEGIITTDSRGVIETFNHAAQEIFGYAESEAVGSSVGMLMPAVYRSQHDEQMRSHQQAPSPHLVGLTREVAGQRKSGETFPLEITVTELVDQKGHKYVALMRDVSDRKKAEEELRLAAQVMDSSLEAIVITDANEIIRAVNPAFTEITGYSQQEVIGNKPSMLSSGRHDKRFFQQMWHAIDTHGKWQGEIWDRRKSGEVYPKWLSITSIKNDDGEVSHYVGIASDITELKQSEERLEHLAHYDPLTELPNRMLFQDRLTHAIAQCRRNNGQLALLFVDLDRFKSVNDSFGHEVGDQLLVAVAERLQRCVREGDTIARLGGDEFVVIISNLADPSDAVRVAEHLVSTLREPFYIQRNECFIGSSIGIGIYPDDGDDSETLSRNADTAMYRAKMQGGDSYNLYDEKMGEEASRRLLLSTRLRHALERGQLAMHYQPVVSGFDNKVVAVEALMRWYEPEFGSITPAEFIPLAEDSGLIGSLGRWALDTACAQFREWQEAGVALERVSVNVSPRQLLQPGLPEYISELLEKHGVQAECLELELTETAVMDYSETAARFFDHVERIGVRLSIDDFGTGYSSLAYIKQLPIHTLKVDRSFVRDLHRDTGSREIVRAVIALAHSLGLDVVAEGVQELGQLDFLRSQGCELMQGWLYSKALDAEMISTSLADSMELAPGLPVE